MDPSHGLPQGGRVRNEFQQPLLQSQQPLLQSQQLMPQGMQQPSMLQPGLNMTTHDQAIRTLDTLEDPSGDVSGSTGSIPAELAQRRMASLDVTNADNRMVCEMGEHTCRSPR